MLKFLIVYLFKFDHYHPIATYKKCGLIHISKIHNLRLTNFEFPLLTNIILKIFYNEVADVTPLGYWDIFKQEP